MEILLLKFNFDTFFNSLREVQNINEWSRNIVCRVSA